MAALARHTNPEYKRWVKLLKGLYMVKDVLCPHVEQVFDDFHLTALSGSLGAFCCTAPTLQLVLDRILNKWSITGTPACTGRCADWLDAIAAEHLAGNRRDLFRFSDLTQMNSSSWEIGKTFLPPAQAGSTSGPAELDPYYLTKMITQCRLFSKPPHDIHDAVEKVLKIRNELAHAALQGIKTDAEVKVKMNDMIDLVRLLPNAAPSTIGDLEKVRDRRIEEVDEDLSQRELDIIRIFLEEAQQLDLLGQELGQVATGVQGVRQRVEEGGAMIMGQVQDVRHRVDEGGAMIMGQVQDVRQRVDEGGATIMGQVQDVRQRVDEGGAMIMGQVQDARRRVDEGGAMIMGQIQDVRHRVVEGGATIMGQVQDVRQRVDEGGATIMGQVQDVRQRVDQGNAVIIGQVQDVAKGLHELGSVVERQRSGETLGSQREDSTQGKSRTDDAVEDLRAELAKTYLTHYSKLQPVPWADITLPINLIYQEQTLQGREHAWRKHDSSSELKRIFEPSEERGPRPSRVLINGVPGMGKSTLCQRLLESWALRVRDRLPTPTESASKPASHDELESSRLHEYMLVFFLRVRELDEEGLVNNLLLNLVDESWRDEERLKRCIRDNIRQVLLLIDGYDEGDEEQKKSVDRWLTGLGCRGCTIIVTSRPGFCRPSPPPDTTYTLEGLDQTKQRSYAQRFDELMGGEPGEKSVAEQLKELPFQHLDFLQIPLMLALVCFLARQGHSVLPQSVTGLYDMFFQFMSDKAMRDPINFSEEHLSKLKQLLQKVAFDLYCSTKSEMTSDILSKHLSKSEINKTMIDLCKLGLVCQEIKLKGLRNNQTGTFLHQSFLDYIAARHFVSLGEEERSALLGKIVINENNVMLVFVAGLCGESEEHRECFRQMMEAWKRAAERASARFNHSVLHACLLWVGELQDPTWLRTDHVTDINQMFRGIDMSNFQTLRGITLHYRCGVPCLRGVTALVHCAAQHHDSLSSHSALQRLSPLQWIRSAFSRLRHSLSSHNPLNLYLHGCPPSAVSALLDLLQLTLPPNVKLTCWRLTFFGCLNGDECERLGAVLPRLTYLWDLDITVSSLTALNAVSRGFNSTSLIVQLSITYSRSSPRNSPVTAADPWWPPDELFSNINRLSELEYLTLFLSNSTLTMANKKDITRRLKERLPPRVKVQVTCPLILEDSF